MSKLNYPKKGHKIKWYDPRLNVPATGQNVLIVDQYKTVKQAYYRIDKHGEVEGFTDPNDPEHWQSREIINDRVLYWTFMKFEIPEVLSDYLICSKESYL